MKKRNYYLVKYKNVKQIMSGLEISLLQTSGCEIKIIKRLTKKEIEDENKKHRNNIFN